MYTCLCSKPLFLEDALLLKVDLPVSFELFREWCRMLLCVGVPSRTVGSVCCTAGAGLMFSTGWLPGCLIDPALWPSWWSYSISCASSIVSLFASSLGDLST
jgi:hypothetical protein